MSLLRDKSRTPQREGLTAAPMFAGRPSALVPVSPGDPGAPDDMVPQISKTMLLK